MAHDTVAFMEAHKDEPFFLNYWAFSVHRRIGGLDVVLALQIPNDPNRAHVIGPTQMQNLFHHIFGGLVRVVVGAAASATRQTLIT
jgi:hypothetical protein